jgi:hypothetical protein
VAVTDCRWVSEGNHGSKLPKVYAKKDPMLVSAGLEKPKGVCEEGSHARVDETSVYIGVEPANAKLVGAEST